MKRKIKIATSASYNNIPEIWEKLRQCDVVLTSSHEMASQIDSPDMAHVIVVVVSGQGVCPSQFKPAELEALCSVLLREPVDIISTWRFSDAMRVAVEIEGGN